MYKDPITFDAPITFNVKKDEVGFVSHCPEFDIYSQGDTEESAKKNLKEAIFLFFQSCYDRGTLLDVLKDCGYELCSEIKPLKKTTIKPLQQRNKVKIPLNHFPHAETHTS